MVMMSEKVSSGFNFNGIHLARNDGRHEREPEGLNSRQGICRSRFSHLSTLHRVQRKRISTLGYLQWKPAAKKRWDGDI